MPVPEITLSGDALIGIRPELIPVALMGQLPQTVKLGRNRPAGRPQALSLDRYVNLLQVTPRPSVDWYTKAAASMARMYLNDRYGCCVISGKAHLLGGWSANDDDSGGLVLATDSEILSQYQSVCGPGDNGCYIPRVLDYMKSAGFMAGGKKYRIKGYVACDWTSKELVQVAIDLFGGATIGINLPSAWTSAAVWDVTSTGIVGGHDVSPLGYGKLSVVSTTADGVVVSSWGRLYLITWPAFLSRRWLEEMYVMVPETLWTGLDGKSPSGVMLNTLLSDLDMVGGGNIPPLPDPDPIPPVPPVPPVVPPSPPPPPVTVFPAYQGQCGLSGYTYDRLGRVTGTFSGTGPVKLSPVTATLDSGADLPDQSGAMSECSHGSLHSHDPEPADKSAADLIAELFGRLRLK